MMPSKLRMLTRPWTAILVLAAFVVVSVCLFSLGPFAKLASWDSGTFVFDMRGDYDVSAAGRNLEALGSQGRALYRRFVVFDTAWLTLNGVVTVVLLFSALEIIRRKPSRLRWLAGIPLLAAGLDLVENALIWRLLDTRADLSARLVSLTSKVTSTKLIFAPLTMILLGLSTLVVIYAILHSKSTSKWPLSRTALSKTS